MPRWPGPRDVLPIRVPACSSRLHTSAIRLRTRPISKHGPRSDGKPDWVDRALFRRDRPKIWSKEPPFRKLRLRNRYGDEDEDHDDEWGDESDPANDPKRRARRLEKIFRHVWNPEASDGVGDTRLLADLDPTGDLWPAFTARVRAAIGRPTTVFETELVKHLSSTGSWRPAAVHLVRFAFIDEALAAQGFDFARSLDSVPDTRNPTEWYPRARQVQRKIHLHVGPTNSGKTYHALKKLEAAATGYYAGPLRLLAHEVYSRFLAQGISIDLVTGDDVRLNEDPETHKSSSTVEMVNLSHFYDVAVIDEIQMIADPDRGWAWTRAVLGSKAKELHLCGEERVVPLIQELAATTGDTLEVHRYERLNPLIAQSRSLRGDLRKLRKGDCVVSFSVVNIHALKKHIENETGRHVAIVYGSLPPDTRAQQAALFNDPDNDYDFLVASDAIGMGLNLTIKRIVFEGVTKFNGQTHEPISVSQLKQIAGRAGRYKPAVNDKAADNSSTVGLVTCLDENDLPVIQRALNTDASPIQNAGLMPPGEYLEEYYSRLPDGLPFEYLLSRVCQAASTDSRYKICDIRSQLAISRAVEPVQGLDVAQRLALSAAPADLRTNDGIQVLRAFASCIAESKEVTIADVPEIPLETLDREPEFNKAYLGSLEVLHKAIILYCWLGYRFSYVFKDLDMAFHAKQLTEERINTCLSHFSANSRWRKRLERMKADLGQESSQESSQEDTAAAADSNDQPSSSSSDPATPSQAVLPVDPNRAEAPSEDDSQELDLAVEELLQQAGLNQDENQSVQSRTVS